MRYTKRILSTLTLATIVMSIALSTVVVNSADGAGPTVYLVPSDNIYDTTTSPIGTKFNVTVWVSDTAYPLNLMMWQVYFKFDDSLINITQVTVGSKNPVKAWPHNDLGGRNWDAEYVFYNQAGGAIGNPTYYNLGAGSGALMIGDLLMDDLGIGAPKKLCAMEFEIKKHPDSPGDKLSCALNINNENTFLYDANGEVASTKVDGRYEISKPITPPPKIHDVAVIGVVPSKSSVELGESLTVDVTVRNKGTSSETFDTTAYFDSTAIGVQSVTLSIEETKTVAFGWTPNTVGAFTIRGVASTVPGENSTADNTFTDGTVTVTPPPPPPTGKIFTVEWTNWTYTATGNPFGGNFSWHNGTYPVWKNFTVLYGGNADLGTISVRYPLTTPVFRPSRYEIRTFPSPQEWKIKVNLEDRLVEFIAVDGGLRNGMYAIVSIEFIDGPTTEDCINGHVFDVTVSEHEPRGQTFYLTEYIDKTPPAVQITFPDAQTPSEPGYVFVKRADGHIWVQMPNCTNRDIRLLWINGTASDTCSGIDRVEIWINGTYMGDATLSEPSGAKRVSWSWSTDPSKDPKFWVRESWFYVVARAYDNSVADERIARPGKYANLPETNWMETPRHWFFWMYGTNITVPQDWVPGNGRIDIEGVTGFYPGGRVQIWISNDLYNVRRLLTEVNADHYGRFRTTIHHLPELPRKPMCGEQWNITAVDIKGNSASDFITIVPWITYENTLDQVDAKTWQTTLKGNVGDTMTVYGHGFLPSRQTAWDPYSTVYVRIVYTDVAPLEKWDVRKVFNGTSETNYDIMTWYPRLSEVVLAEATTDANGYWSARIQIPQSYGGLHAIYAYEYKLVTDTGMPGPRTDYRLTKSGWPECTGVKAEEQAIIFDVWPTIEIDPATALTDQYVTIKCEGLPLPRYYKLWKNDSPIYRERDWCFVLDFDDNGQWVFENKRIRNNEFDQSWATGMWYPFSYYSPDIADYLNSPVWAGKLASVLMDYATEDMQFHIGSKFLKVPVLPANKYQVRVYYFDKNAEAFTHDHDASLTVNVLKDPLNINMEVGAFHLPGEIVNVFVNVDVDGTAANTTTLSLALFKGGTKIIDLTPESVATGAYVATFTCPAEAGDYFVQANAGKEYETFTLCGSAIAGFTINPTLNDINAKVIALNETVATLVTEVGNIRVDLAAVNGKVVAIDQSVVTIKTDVGLLKTNIANMNGNIAGMHDDMLTIQTAIGELNATLHDVNGVVSIKGDIATIKTDVETLKGKVTSIQGDVATIETNIGTLTTKANSIEGNTGLQPITIGLSLIAALAAIAAAVLILRRVYSK